MSINASDNKPRHVKSDAWQAFTKSPEYAAHIDAMMKIYGCENIAEFDPKLLIEHAANCLFDRMYEFECRTVHENMLRMIDGRMNK